jgi:hypothetical protein
MARERPRLSLARGPCYCGGNRKSQRGEVSVNNVLYLVVLPLIHMDTGRVEQTLTLLPDRNFATEFFPEEVDGYEVMFRNRIKHLVGGRVTGYSMSRQSIPNGRIVVKVEQNVS